MQRNNNLLGITGFARSGKTESLKYITSAYGFTAVSPSEVIREELVRLHGKRKFSRDEMRDMGTLLKQTQGAEFILNGIEDKIDATRVAIDGVRNLRVARAIHKMGGAVIGVVARPEVRYARDLLTTDNKAPAASLDEFIAQEQPELDSDLPYGMQLLRVLQETDPSYIIDTSDMSIDEFRSAIDDVMDRLCIEGSTPAHERPLLETDITL